MNPETIDDLYQRWQRNPDAAETAALCDALRGGRRPDLVEIVGSHASRQPDVGSLLAAARMYTDTGRLDDAQTVLLSAGRIAPREGNVYRWLGEVLLRRGDADRAQKVLEKAVQFGAEAAATALLERAKALVPTQQASGQSAVAEAVSRSASPYLQPPASAPPAPAPTTGRRGRIIPADSDEDVETQIRKSDEIKAVMDGLSSSPNVADMIEAALAPISSAPMPAAGRPPEISAPPPMQAPPRSTPPPPFARDMLAMPPPDDIIFTTPTRGLGFDIGYDKPSTRENDASEISSSELVSDVAPMPRSEPVPAATASFRNLPDLRDSDQQVGAASSMPLRATGSPRNLPAAPPVNPMLLEALARPPLVVGGAQVPEPRDVLDALQIAGIYEPEGAAGPQVYAWSEPARTKRLMSTMTLVGLAVILVLGGFGTFYYVRDKRAKEHVQAEGLLANVDRDLHASDPHKLDDAEKAIKLSFELESRSTHAALTWVRERALVGLLKGGADIAFEDAVQRAKVVGIEEKTVAFAHVASFLYQGDTAGAAATVAKWDALAQNDAWFQLLAGATFERAGDPRAIERYDAAVKLDPELVIAQILLTRAMTIDGDPRRAMELAKDFHARYPDRLEGSALMILTWTRDPLRGEAPPEIQAVIDKGDTLPVSLRSVPHAARAILALHRGAIDEARPWIQKGLEVVDTPGIAAWLGSIALVMGDENLARKAALSAVSFSAVYPPARVLAARVALLGARLDEALKATEDLPPSSPDVAIITAAASYEKLDGEHMKSAFEAIPDETKKMPFAVPLVRGLSLLGGNIGGVSGEKILDMADDEAPWADLVAMDWVLDVGDLELAKKIAAEWRGDPKAMRAVRLARLARYEGRLDDADKLSRLALESGTVTMRVLTERVFTLVAMKKDAEALAIFKAYPNVGGPLARWLRAYATAAHGKIDEARAIVAQEDPPSPASSMPARMIAASAFGMMKDTRHGGDYTKPILQAGFTNPDVMFVAEKLNLPKIQRRAKW